MWLAAYLRLIFLYELYLTIWLVDSAALIQQLS